MDLARAIDLLRDRVPGLALVTLYGSHARGDAGPESDVDLVDLWSADDVLRVQVIEHGRVLYERDAEERARFEMHALSRYAHLNEERRAILEDVVRRGSVYG
jgi:predicted nucleotidyltransferase